MLCTESKRINARRINELRLRAGETLTPEDTRDFVVEPKNVKNCANRRVVCGRLRYFRFGVLFPGLFVLRSGPGEPRYPETVLVRTRV